MAVVVMAVLFLYSGAIRLDYVWDDWPLFINSPALRNVEGVEDFLSSVSRPILLGTTYFRPIVLSTFALEYALLGTKPIYAHLINVCIFGANICLVCYISLKFARLLFKKSSGFEVVAASCIAALFYGLHPAQLEAVAWISGRFDLLVVLFSLLCIISCLFFQGVARHVFSALFLLCALLSKEMAATVPVIVFLLANATWRLQGVGSSLRRVASLLAPLVFSFALYVILKFLIFGALTHVDKSVTANLTPLKHFAFIGQTALFYAKLLLWPFSDLNPQHPFDIRQMTPLMMVLGAGSLLLFSCGMVFLAWKRSVGSYILLAAMISYAPILNIMPLTIGGNIGHERFMAFPLAMWALAIVPALFGIWDKGVKPWVTSIVFAAWVLLSVANVSITLPLWRDDITLWTWAYSKHPNLAFVQLNLGSAYLKFQEYEKLSLLMKTVEAKGSVPKGFEFISGSLKIKKGEYLLGIREIEHALSFRSLPHHALRNLGIPISNVKTDVRNYTDAGEVAFACMALAEGYRKIGDYSRSLAAAETVTFYSPDYPPAFFAKALALFGEGRQQEGEVAFAQAQTHYMDETRPYMLVLKQDFLTEIKAGNHPAREASEVGPEAGQCS